jgi:HlyD family secretion protein
MTTRPAHRSFCTLALAVVWLAGCGESPDPQATQATATALAIPTVTATRIVELPIADTLTASGSLLPREEAAVAPEVAGYQVANVLVEEGAQVKSGQVLAQLDPELLLSKIDQAKAALAQATAVAEQAGAEADRVKNFDSKNVMSAEQIATRRYQARTTAAAVEVSRAQLAELLTQQKRLEIRAPVDGIVLERNVRPGDVASLNQPMFRLARDGLVELDAEVPESVLSRIALGDAAAVTLPSGAVLPGTVRLISPRVDPETKLGRVRVRLAPDPQLRVGGYARVEFTQPAVPVPAVSEKAVQWEATGPWLITIDDQNRAHLISVRTGARNGGYVVLEQGPPVGTLVAMGSGVALLEGDRVNPIEAGQRTEAGEAAQQP